MRKWLLILFLIPASLSFGNEAGIYISHDFEVQEANLSTFSDELVDQPKHQKLKAVLLTIFLGHFGVHRIYLGTSPNVPVVYSLTLGGGLGLLPLVDLVTILGTKDLSKFQNSDKVFMWQE